MKKKHFILPVLSTVLLAPAFLASQVFAEENAAEPSSPAVTASDTGSADTASAPAASEASTSEANSGTEPADSANAPAAAADPVAAAAPASAADPAAAQTNSLPEATILHTNDVHGRIVEEKGVIGDAKLATVIKEERAKNPNVLVVDAGDAFQGLPISNSSKGEERAKILNEIGYDAMAVGNHEFDFGLDEARKYKEILKFPLLSSNTYANNARVFQASTIVDKDPAAEGDEFVVIGVTTPETATKTHPKNIPGVTFTDPITEVNRVIAEVEARAAAEGKTYNNYVILAHLGVDTTTPVEWRGSTLAEALSHNEALKGKRVTVIDGHSHTVQSTTYGDNVTYNQTGSYLHNIGKVTFQANQLLGNPQQISAETAKAVTPDPTVAAMVSKIKEKYDAESAAVVVDKSPVELNGDRENVRVRETNLGNVVADALYQYGQTGFANKTDLAVTNGGGLRETIAKDKPITKGNIIAVLPFGNTISQIKVTGQNIADMFTKSLGSTLQEKDGQPVLDENGQPLLEASGGFLQVSGAKVYYDTNLPADQRVLYIEILNKESGVYEPLDPAKTYYLTTNDFLAAGGDGYTMLGGAREEGPSMDVAFADYLATADLTAYAVINPNSRTISLSSAKDSDGDGYTDIAEIKAGTNPADAASYPVIAKPGDPAAPAKPAASLADPASAASGQTKPVAVHVAKTFTKDPAAKELPQTGSESAAALSLAGMVLAFFGLAGIKKIHKDN
ncbi:cell surface ecto-5'-nucleotidase Nt5e [Streptococcus panodentis]|uniref:Bifunctional metallophosphatase/5'-nucleotidase n=1 Tax=Streptococcus panodentis TaxID=1581472 RepID=A0ABS5AXA3_9STRE|nr:cell surface ecto-5'-nucleotidase Nt5e [Streptococcus panodentis]MBP2621081.1 bifunctional metallophosphatase/5'-nucleotidase [Streptococcus panodentis]